MATTLNFRAMTDAELSLMAQGCTELTCLYHGQVNAERRRREMETAALRRSS